MDYILTQKEYNDIHDNYKKQISELQETINKLCIDVCDYKPTFKGWRNDYKETIPWGCIHSEENWHCDECSVQKYCTLDKDYSK